MLDQLLFKERHRRARVETHPFRARLLLRSGSDNVTSTNHNDACSLLRCAALTEKGKQRNSHLMSGVMATVKGRKT